MKTYPKLLVSVRDADEAKAAIAGGCDILDVKEPHAGSLGRASSEVWHEIADVLETSRLDQLPLSLALGELSEFASSGQIPAEIPLCTRFLKVGLSGALDEWSEMLRQFQTQVEEVNGRCFHWVSVAYVDYQQAESPTIEDVLEHAIEAESPVFLLDTFQKDWRKLFDWVSLERLQHIAATCAAHDIQVALAGRIGAADLPKLNNVDIDIIAVRSAVCEEGERTGTMASEAVQKFRKTMNQCFPQAETNGFVAADVHSAD